MLEKWRYLLAIRNDWYIINPISTPKNVIQVPQKYWFIIFMQFAKPFSSKSEICRKSDFFIILMTVNTLKTPF